MSATRVLDRYAECRNVQDPIGVLRLTALRLQSLAFQIGRARIEQATAPGQWSARDIFCHLADTEIGFAYRLRQIQAEGRDSLPPFDEKKWATPYAVLDCDEALAAFSRLRHWNLLLIEFALAAQERKPVRHAEWGRVAFSSTLEIMSGHDVQHLGELERLAAV